ncbi:cucumber peeling cupredoxin-like [Cynara cardunculus var. scolymus]|uniref:Blue (Type 1) copper domain-containing protein n=1 Tax=Cynara cardunculus var. scolymus TaxID=59895 RepID=A0A124SEV6_CYNCS|nr:cucumber peeling cupredoxin-like [Cynara cardunculus var. scolymus]KVI01321.1 Blue (type 1) copper domain-containing protein [Cynara cardunculus var. scolymus]
MAGSKFMLVMVVASMIQLQTTVAQTNHTVGDTLGWTIPSAANAYATWASGQNFTVGDSLIFNFPTGAHDVAEVTEAAYGPCTITDTINTTTTGPATINLRTAGPHYYICTFGTHCQSGQKLAINVSATASTPPSSSTPPPAGNTTPPPSPSTASPTLTTVVPITFLVGSLAALFY